MQIADPERAAPLPERSPNPSTPGRNARVSLSFFVAAAARCGRRKGVRAAGMHEEAFSHQHSAISQTGAKNHMFLRDAFVKDPSTSLRISLGGSDAARTAQMYYFAIEI